MHIYRYGAQAIQTSFMADGLTVHSQHIMSYPGKGRHFFELVAQAESCLLIHSHLEDVSYESIPNDSDRALPQRVTVQLFFRVK